ncbi:MAG TPA: hypothetical protein PK183_04695 [Bacillota bacterium]|jgi:hypothetical protein|nr:hypothetical protein [Bacillota bacterium]
MYEYDFGDSWQHTITLEKTVSSDTLEVTYLDGRGERPSEDVGGSWGYMELWQTKQIPNMRLWAASQAERKRSYVFAVMALGCPKGASCRSG